MEDRSHPSHPHSEGWGSLVVAGVEMGGHYQRCLGEEEWRQLQDDRDRIQALPSHSFGG